MTDEQLAQARKLFEDGKIPEAQEFLWHIIEEDSTDETAWLWYAYTFPTSDEKIQVLTEGLRFNIESQSLQDAVATLNNENEGIAQEQSKTLSAFQVISEKIKPYFEKFGGWFTNQEGVVKAAVVSAVGLMATVFITGCFSLIAALIARPSAPSSTIITATLPPTATAYVTSTPDFFLTPQPTLTTQAIPNDPLFVRPTPILEWLHKQSKLMSFQFRKTFFGALGGALLILGLWQIWLIFLNKKEKNKDTIFSSILTVISLFVAWQLLGWLAVVIGVVGTLGILVLFLGVMISAVLKVPYLGGSIVGALVGLFLGIGIFFIYFAISDLFIVEYIDLALLIGSVVGSILGLILCSINGGLWHSLDITSQPSTNET